jgi:hypothetical protein
MLQPLADESNGAKFAIVAIVTISAITLKPTNMI